MGNTVFVLPQGKGKGEKMTEQQIILTLATKVMGWKRYGETEFWHGENGNLFDSSLWNPLQNIADAWLIVEKMGQSEHKNKFDHYIDSNFFITELTPERICQAAVAAILASKEQTIKEAYPNHFS